MKKKTASAVVVRRSAPMVSKAKYERLVHVRSVAAKKAKEVAKQRMGTLVGMAACGVIGWAEKNGKMPDMFGFEPTAVLGVGLGFVVPALVKGKAGQMAAEVGASVAGVAAYKLAAGAPLRVGEDDYQEDETAGDESEDDFP